MLGVKGLEVYTIKNDGFTDRDQVNLLLTMVGDNSHYVAVKDMSRLLSSQSKSNGHRKHICLNCLQLFNSKITRDNHHHYCISNLAMRIDMPDPGSVVVFNDYHNHLKDPFVIDLDSQTIHSPVNRTMAGTTVTSEHIPSGFCIYTQ